MAVTLDIEAAIALLHDQLFQRAESLPDPVLQELVSKIKHLKTTIQIASEFPAAMVNSNGYRSARYALSTNGNSNGQLPTSEEKHMSQGDKLAALLEAAGRPLHINKIVKEMQAQYGIATTKARMIGIIGGDRRGRFIRTETSTFGLNPNPKPFAMSPALARKRKDHPFPVDFSLIESIRKLLPELEGEFSQRTIYDILVERYPVAAPYVDRASIAKTLNKLRERGVIEMTYKGYGQDPRRYKRKENGLFS